MTASRLLQTATSTGPKLLFRGGRIWGRSEKKRFHFELSAEELVLAPSPEAPRHHTPVSYRFVWKRDKGLSIGPMARCIVNLFRHHSPSKPTLVGKLELTAQLVILLVNTSALVYSPSAIGAIHGDCPISWRNFLALYYAGQIPRMEPR